MTLYPYMAHDGEPECYAILVFAPSAREAKRLAWPTIQGFSCGEADYTQMRVLRMRQHADYLMTLGNPKKINTGEPHIIDSPPVCPRCALWGHPSKGDGCTYCEER